MKVYTKDANKGALNTKFNKLGQTTRKVMNI